MSMASTAVSTTTKMLAAMCVRKTGDSGSQREVIGSSNTTVKKKHKPFRVMTMKSRSSQRETKREKEKEAEERRVIVPKVHVQDDEDGHLIYRKGDVLESRCELGSERKVRVHGKCPGFLTVSHEQGAK